MAVSEVELWASIVATESSAAHWENVATHSPADVAFHCRDYAQHLRTIVECLRMDLLERDLLPG
jgi:hypothetical protein